MPENEWIDLRSDTVTKPTPAMRQAIAEAEVGDDVLGDDPTVVRLQQRIAELLGKEAALFVPSGTMGNQIAIRTHCRPGEELICEAESHIDQYEQGGAAQLSGVSTRAVPGEHGVLRLEQLQGLIRPQNVHLVRTRLLTLENTHNRGGGRIQPFEPLREMCAWAYQSGLRTHLDGARLFNAVIASGISADQWAEPFDSVSVCFSKGLGAPVGSALVGSKEFIAEALRHRKVLGGGMRQVGILAAAALFALDYHIDRLAEDHAHAAMLAETIRSTEGLRLNPETVDTNIVIFEIDPVLATAASFAARLQEQGIGMIPFGPQSVRACTHLDVSREQMVKVCRVLPEVAEACRRGTPSTAAEAAKYAG